MIFFGGWNFEAKDAQKRVPGRIGYSKGVPMGGDLEFVDGATLAQALRGRRPFQ